MAKLLSLLALMIYTHCLQAQDFGAYQKHVFIHGADTLRYRILYPENYKEHSYPLVIFLHGAGERGNDTQIILQRHSPFADKPTSNYLQKRHAMFPYGSFTVR
ncbi:hypothetical protein [Chitinophaga sp. LS1]|uniref:hypothetical protein n=1 Tax=Chitinophaga sp. LS1 TaxID=3051176 RepID=UPI002AAB06C8|nr:hypothetical protein [Chitinophaga sp. LS1]WPV70314.1 hypothetical protein QQL36_16525 [Chitinophaga sp. LS1]